MSRSLDHVTGSPNETRQKQQQRHRQQQQQQNRIIFDSAALCVSVEVILLFQCALADT